MFNPSRGMHGLPCGHGTIIKGSRGHRARTCLFSLQGSKPSQLPTAIISMQVLSATAVAVMGQKVGACRSLLLRNLCFLLAVLAHGSLP